MSITCHLLLFPGNVLRHLSMENTPDKNTQQNGQHLAIITAYFCTQESIQRIQTSAVVNNITLNLGSWLKKSNIRWLRTLGKDLHLYTY